MYKPIKFTITTIQILFCLFLMGCSNDVFGPAKKNPRIGEENISVITGTTDGMKFSDFNKSSQSGDSMPVNALLWRAALDIASLVPLDDVDTFGGSIVTEWYQAANTTDQRLKLTIFVLGLELRSDAIKVQAYTQKKLSNDWVDSGRDEALALRLEELILTRARELRAESVSEITQ